MVSVAAITDDFESAVLIDKHDRETLPKRLHDRQTPEYAEVAALAEVGMGHIQRDLLALVPPDQAELDRAYDTLRRLHGSAYGWEPPDVPGLEQLGATRMRQYVRAWINEWDLLRLDPEYRPLTDVVDIPGDYRELVELNDDGDS